MDQARKFSEVAALVAGEEGVPASRSVAAALAVLAGIAASDAACCMALGRRARGDDHRQASELLRQVPDGGADAARALDELLALKDTAHYGLIEVEHPLLRRALRRGAALVEFAATVSAR
jgi:hypothetical protein